MHVPQIFFFLIFRFEFRHFISKNLAIMEAYIGMHLDAPKKKNLVSQHKNCHICGTTRNFFKILFSTVREWHLDLNHLQNERKYKRKKRVNLRKNQNKFRENFHISVSNANFFFKFLFLQSCKRMENEM